MKKHLLWISVLFLFATTTISYGIVPCEPSGDGDTCVIVDEGTE